MPDPLSEILKLTAAIRFIYATQLERLRTEMSTNSLDQELKIEGHETVSNLIKAYDNADRGFLAPLEMERSSRVPVMVPLRSLTEWMHSDSIRSLLNDFISVDPDGASFLRCEALHAEEESIARTYLFMDISIKTKILAFFTIGTSHMYVPAFETLSDDMMCSLNVSSHTGYAPTYLISHLCTGTNSDISLSALFDSAMSMIRCSWKTVGCRLIRLDCSDSTIGFFESRGFTFIRKNDDKDLNQMLYVT